jgi:hypothetical protein
MSPNTCSPCPRSKHALKGRGNRFLVRDGAYPRPTNGIFVAMMVMNWTFESSGRLAM